MFLFCSTRRKTPAATSSALLPLVCYRCSRKWMPLLQDTHSIVLQHVPAQFSSLKEKAKRRVNDQQRKDRNIVHLPLTMKWRSGRPKANKRKSFLQCLLSTDISQELKNFFFETMGWFSCLPKAQEAVIAFSLQSLNVCFILFCHSFG